MSVGDFLTYNIYDSNFWLSNISIIALSSPLIYSALGNIQIANLSLSNSNFALNKDYVIKCEFNVSFVISFSKFEDLQILNSLNVNLKLFNLLN